MARKKVFRIRLSEFEANLLAKKADEKGMKVTRYVRTTLFPKNPVVKNCDTKHNNVVTQIGEKSL